MKKISPNSNRTGNTSNRRKPWTDEELKIVLSFSPTYENTLLLADAFKRGRGSIAQICLWGRTSKKIIKIRGKENHKFINQIKRVTKEMGIF